MSLGPGAGGPLTILCLGAHSDDIEIGAGGTLLRLLAERPGTRVNWVVFTADDDREAEAQRSAADFLRNAGECEVTVHRFRESYFPYIGAEIKDAFEQLKCEVSPDVVFTHRRDDEHQDHRAIAEFTWNTFRDHLIAEYEIPKYEGDLDHPTLYVPLDTAIRRTEGRAAHGALRHPAQQALVPPRDLPRSDVAARRRVQRRLGRGVPRSQTDDLTQE